VTRFDELLAAGFGKWVSDVFQKLVVDVDVMLNKVAIAELL